MHYYRTYTGSVKRIETTYDNTVTAEHRYFAEHSGIIITLQHVDPQKYELFFFSKQTNDRYIYPDTGNLIEENGILKFETHLKTYIFQIDLEKPCIPEYEFLSLIDYGLDKIEEHYYDAKRLVPTLKSLPSGFNFRSLHAGLCRETSEKMRKKRYPENVE